MYIKDRAVTFAISIHAPHEGERPAPDGPSNDNSNFNPRSPRGGATLCGRCRGFVSLISIHAPHEGERLFCGLAGVQSAQKFQSTLPTRGSDFHYCRRPRNQAIFQSTLPTRGSDIKFFNICGYPSISIHAPHEGERHAPGAYRLDIINISIHAPHEGERPKYKDHPAVAMLFQSTLPTRGSDQAFVDFYEAKG